MRRVTAPVRREDRLGLGRELGIGRGAAERLGAEGAKVLLFGRDEALLEEAAAV